MQKRPYDLNKGNEELLQAPRSRGEVISYNWTEVSLQHKEEIEIDGMFDS